MHGKVFKKYFTSLAYIYIKNRSTLAHLKNMPFYNIPNCILLNVHETKWCSDVLLINN